ncbi:hypothetical protein Slin15195_G084920 [Septoria linicola]|uniref:Uncharacterized protein n=1 Tax=Septoria linicola TaxID=215465 RepID=A0A9Q9EN63_9PEZI|nr:hypothetical protein Slin14017_G087480 [Septoria linicola]USW55173.1 hypothetical protein Slin15195_G084920 [Septoria linicola]
MYRALLIGFAAAATATSGGQNKNAALCSSVNKIVTAYIQQAAATKFCSSCLSLPSRSTITSTVTNSNSPPKTATETSYLTCASPVPGQAPRKNKKRNNKNPAPKPGCYSSFTKPTQISTVCSCLSIPTTPATTTTTKVSSTTTTTVTAVATPTAFGIMAANLFEMHCFKVGSNAPYSAFEADGNPIIPSTFTLSKTGLLTTNDTLDGSTVFAYQRLGEGSAVRFGAAAVSRDSALKCGVEYVDADGTCELNCVKGRGDSVESICFNDGEDTPSSVQDPFCLANETRREYVMVRVNAR